VLSAQPSGKLYQALVETKKAASVSAFSRATHDPGVIEVTAELKNGTPVEEVRDSLISIVEGMKKDGPTKEEVDRAKRQILKARELAASDANPNGASPQRVHRSGRLAAVFHQSRPD